MSKQINHDTCPHCGGDLVSQSGEEVEMVKPEEKTGVQDSSRPRFRDSETGEEYFLFSEKSVRLDKPLSEITPADIPRGLEAEDVCRLDSLED